ncbi:MAG: prepilin peptidase [Fibrobacteria bacterium]|nr:prepilin peptidase [Fibrobacteria bacterium]
MGAAFGSFFNVVAWRLPLGMSLNRPGSHCPKCRTPIPWYRNIPVATWLVQRGKCAWCGCRIPLRYVAVEFFCGVLGWTWALLALRGHWPDAASAGGWLAFALSGVPIALIDWDTFEIPDGLVVFALVSSLLARGILAEQPMPELVLALRDALLACGLLYLISFGSRVVLGWMGRWTRTLMRLSPRSWRRGPLAPLGFRWARFHGDMEALGLGDVSLALAAGAALGFPAIVLGLPFAAVFGMVVHLLRPASVARAQTEGTGLDAQALPFGPFLVAGFLVASVCLQGASIPLP